MIPVGDEQPPFKAISGPNLLVPSEIASVGMDADQVSKCFERFWQGEGGDVRRFGGTGIGLYIVRSLVEAMGGRASVTSAPGYGTTFTFTLPLSGPSHDDLQIATGERSPTREFMRQLGLRSDDE